MSLRSLFKHRAQIQRLEETNVEGLVTAEWVVVASGVPCLLDLSFIRQGKDPIWTPEAGRPSSRTGVLFMMPRAEVRSGDRIRMTKGPKGWYLIEGAVDEAWRPTDFHHYELGVREAGNPAARAAEVRQEEASA